MGAELEEALIKVLCFRYGFMIRMYKSMVLLYEPQLEVINHVWKQEQV